MDQFLTELDNIYPMPMVLLFWLEILLHWTMLYTNSRRKQGQSDWISIVIKPNSWEKRTIITTQIRWF